MVVVGEAVMAIVAVKGNHVLFNLLGLPVCWGVGQISHEREYTTRIEEVGLTGHFRSARV